jgi:hypothetical protein
MRLRDQIASDVACMHFFNEQAIGACVDNYVARGLRRGNYKVLN